MGGWDHGPAKPADDQSAATSARNSRLGLWLFAVYFATYAVFVYLNAFRPETMTTRPLGGIPLSVLYGLSLIVIAFVLALLYAWICRSPAAERPESGA